MALLRERRFTKEEVLVWCSHADGWWNLSEIGKSFHSGCTSRSVQCWFHKDPGFPFSSSFCLPCWPFVWFQRKWWPGRLCVTSSCEWLLVLSTDGDRCCKWRGTFFKVSLYLFRGASMSRWHHHRIRTLTHTYAWTGRGAAAYEISVEGHTYGFAYARIHTLLMFAMY